MIIKDINNLSDDAKEIVLFFEEHYNINHIITVTTDGNILDPDSFPHVQNLKNLLEELKKNGNIKNYTTSLDSSKTKITFEFYC